MSVEFKEATVAEVMQKVGDLFARHWEEVANYKNQVSLEPDYDFYKSLETAGKLISVVAEEEGKMIGYAVFFLTPNAHYKSLLVASNDIIFMLPEKRKGSLGRDLITESENISKSHGANKITFHVKPDHDFSPLLRSMGYLHEETMHGKMI